MSDSDEEEEESYGFYGKPLDPYDEDAFPKKRPITVEEQIATDEQGRRRFHGAFTGGFSAGFFNTVGSLEGWKPSEFKSSRGEKNETKNTRKPEDYMDDEDVGEFGIAPHLVQATSEFSTKRKRKKQGFSEGPIPGVPVLETLIESGNETIGYLLLRNMGFKHDLEEEEEEEEDDVGESSGKVYGCEIPKTYAIKKSFDNSKFQLPEIYTKALKSPKCNTFGFGYSGLDKSHINLFQTSNLVVHDRDKSKKLSIKGQAFGVGAFEEDDEDIYVKDDMSGYDFEMTREKVSKQPSATSNLLHGLFIKSVETLTVSESFPAPVIPHSFTGKHNVKKSRFEPVETGEDKPQSLNAAMRAKYLGETSGEGKVYTQSNQERLKERYQEKKAEKLTEFQEKQRKAVDLGSSGVLFDRFVSASKPEDTANILERIEKSEELHGTEQMREAARMKMFGPLTRMSITWHPSALLCKRFNLPEPLFNEFGTKHERKRTKNLIFEFQKFTDNDDAITHKSGLSTNTDEIIPDDTPIEIDLDSKDVETAEKEDKVIEKVVLKVVENATVETTSLNNSPPIDVMAKVNVAENQDLFRAIFADSSDEEPEDGTTDINAENARKAEETAREKLLKETVLSEQFLPKFKPIKEGILSNIKFSTDKETSRTNIDSNKSMMEVNKTIVEEKKTIVEEIKTIAGGNKTIAGENKTTAEGNKTIAEGNKTITEGNKTITEGNKTIAEKSNNSKEAVDFYGPKLPERIIFKKPGSFVPILIPSSNEDWVEKSEVETKEKSKKSSKKHKKEKKHKKHKHKSKK